MMDEDALRELTADIEKNGQHEPVVYWKGQLIDGRNRVAACKRLDIEPEACELDDDTDPVTWVISANLHRRHLTASQHAMVAARVREMYAEKNREKKGGRPAKDKPPENFREVSDKHANESSAQAGAMVGVSGRSVDHATTVIKKGSPELQAAVDAGEIKVSKAAAIAKSVPKEKQIEVAKAKTVKPPQSFPLSDQYLDILGKCGIALVQINEDFGGCAELFASPKWDKRETSVFKQKVALLHRLLGTIKKELESV